MENDYPLAELVSVPDHRFKCARCIDALAEKGEESPDLEQVNDAVTLVPTTMVMQTQAGFSVVAVALPVCYDCRRTELSSPVAKGRLAVG